MRLEDKAAIITGGAKGVGRAIAETFALEGANILIADLDEKAGGKTADAIQASGGKAGYLNADVSKAGDTQHMVDVVLRDFGKLDILVNSAGLYSRGDVVSTTLEEWNRLLSINLTGVFLSCKAAVPALIASGGGAIINLSSSVGWQYAAPGVAAYVASKFGVTGLTKAMACDYLSDNIRVNCICPGPTDTPFLRSSRSPEELKAFADAQPSGRLASPKEIAAAALFLAGDDASFITGVSFPVDGGQSAFP